MTTPAKRPKYEAKDLNTKVEILRALKNGRSRQEVMKKFTAKRSTLGTYVKNEEQILQAFEGATDGVVPRARTNTQDDIEVKQNYGYAA
ncbi:hypothetical protein HPB48_026461 [Haemaphysalis longicornis]|uniref:HTH psq-type domain-containing protein n=1 Tax=Haemaphysalis longicornis TaxID=44386 RepID=A0A9J6HCC4_HAELO|nr:hypothetical protein HPB48_026461 [Haemaphysalis longicornis]